MCECFQIGGPFTGADPDCPSHGTEARAADEWTEELIRGLRSALSAALGWIDAVPEGVVAEFPAMPGFDRE